MVVFNFCRVTPRQCIQRVPQKPPLTTLVIPHHSRVLRVGVVPLWVRLTNLAFCGWGCENVADVFEIGDTSWKFGNGLQRVDGNGFSVIVQCSSVI